MKQTVFTHRPKKRLAAWLWKKCQGSKTLRAEEKVTIGQSLSTWTVVQLPHCLFSEWEYGSWQFQSHFIRPLSPDRHDPYFCSRLSRASWKSMLWVSFSRSAWPEQAEQHLPQGTCCWGWNASGDVKLYTNYFTFMNLELRLVKYLDSGKFTICNYVNGYKFAHFKGILRLSFEESVYPNGQNVWSNAWFGLNEGFGTVWIWFKAQSCLHPVDVQTQPSVVEYWRKCSSLQIKLGNGKRCRRGGPFVF